MSYVNVKCKWNNEVVNSIMAEAEWVRSGSRIRTSGPRAYAPPRLRIGDPQKYFTILYNVYVVGPDVQRNPALTATGSGSWMRRSFFLYHTYTTLTSCSRLRVAGRAVQLGFLKPRFLGFLNLKNLRSSI